MKTNINGIEFEVDPVFSPEYWKAVESEIWEPQTFKVTDYFVTQSMVVMDVGCWAGPITLYMAAKGATVHAIDPDPVAFNALEKNLRLNPKLADKIKTHNVALGPSNNKGTLNARSAYGNSSSSLLYRTRDKISTVETEVVTVGSFLKSNGIDELDFVKIDIEGGEFSILEQLGDLIPSLNYPTLLISFHYSHLNEFIYRSKQTNKWISLFAMKIEKQLGSFWHMSELENRNKQVALLANRNKYLYNSHGEIVSIKKLRTSFWKKKYAELVLTNIDWLAVD